MPSCASIGIAHHGGLVVHGQQQMYALVDGEVRRMAHPDDVAKALADSGQERLDVLIVTDGQPAPDPEHFGLDRVALVNQQILRSSTDAEQARRSHQFPVPAGARKQLTSMVAQAGVKVGQHAGSMQRVQVEAQRWVELAQQVGLHDLHATMRSFEVDGFSPHTTGAAWMRTLCEHQLRQEGRLGNAKRRVLRPGATVDQTRLSPRLAKLNPVAGERPHTPIRMLPPQSTGGRPSHFEVRFAERVTGAVGFDQKVAAAAGDSPEQIAQALVERDEQLDALTRSVAMAEALLTDPVHDARFAFNATELSRNQAAELSVSGQHDRVAFEVDDPGGRTDVKLVIVATVEGPPSGTKADQRRATWVRPVTCFHEPIVAGATTNRADLVDAAAPKAFSPEPGEVGFGDPRRTEQRLGEAMSLAIRRRRQAKLGR